MVRANTTEMQGESGLTGDVGGMYLEIIRHGQLLSYLLTYFAALGVAVWRSKHPSGSIVAVVSRCITSRP